MRLSDVAILSPVSCCSVVEGVTTQTNVLKVISPSSVVQLSTDHRCPSLRVSPKRRCLHEPPTRPKRRCHHKSTSLKTRCLHEPPTRLKTMCLHESTSPKTRCLHEPPTHARREGVIISLRARREGVFMSHQHA